MITTVALYLSLKGRINCVSHFNSPAIEPILGLILAMNDLI